MLALSTLTEESEREEEEEEKERQTLGSLEMSVLLQRLCKYNCCSVTQIHSAKIVTKRAEMNGK
jgi:hypothetical protein